MQFLQSSSRFRFSVAWRRRRASPCLEIESILIGIRSIPRQAGTSQPRLVFVSHGNAAHLRKGSSMANTEAASDFDDHLTDQERFQVGGRDTVLLVWSLIL